MGSNEESYVMLPSFACMLENCNPDSIISLETKKDDQFFHIFFCLTTFIQGLPHSSPMLILDGTFLNVKYHRTLSACGMDADKKFLPLAFAVVESKNISS